MHTTEAVHKSVNTHKTFKARLAMLGKRQTDLFEELNRIGGQYAMTSTSYLSDIINGRQNGAKAQTIRLKCLQILNQWEMEAST
jgi:hypothetical protein